jgi:hypothetical protein
MTVTTFEAIVDKGQIRLPTDIHLPENTKVYVVVPNVDLGLPPKIASPRLVHRQEGADFKKEILPGT